MEGSANQPNRLAGPLGNLPEEKHKSDRENPHPYHEPSSRLERYFNPAGYHAMSTVSH
jgi:hypothetical protein